MKYLFFLSFLLLSFNSIQAQDEKEELLEQLSNETCDCIGDRELNMENMEMIIGLCVLQASGDKVDDIQSILGYELFNEQDMTSLGEDMGMRMIFSCEAIQKLMIEAAAEGGLEDYLDKNATTDEVIGQADGEAWVDIERPRQEEDYGDGPSEEVYIEEVFPPTEEEWIDIDRPAEEEEYGNGAEESFEDYGGEEIVERAFITEPMPNTNRTAINYLVLEGQVKDFDAGVFSQAVVRDESGKEYQLYLIDNVPGAGLLRRRANLKIMYRETQRFDASTGDPRTILEIVRVEER